MKFRDYLTPEQLRAERVENVAIGLLMLTWLAIYLLARAGVLA